jgi:hypothetical protein
MKFPASIGDVVQINETDSRPGWRGAFVMVTEVRSWGIQGFVHHIETHEKSGFAYTRQEWDTIDFIGRAVLLPQSELTPQP